jgi:hypothetical protein
MPSTHNVDLCDNWDAEKGDSVNWQSIPSTCTSSSTCTISQDGSNDWPFNESSPISIPSPSNTNTLKNNLVTGKIYYYNVSCCSVHTVTITGR